MQNTLPHTSNLLDELQTIGAALQRTGEATGNERVTETAQRILEIAGSLRARAERSSLMSDAEDLYTVASPPPATVEDGTPHRIVKGDFPMEEARLSQRAKALLMALPGISFIAIFETVQTWNMYHTTVRAITRYSSPPSQKPEFTRFMWDLFYQCVWMNAFLWALVVGILIFGAVSYHKGKHRIAAPSAALR